MKNRRMYLYHAISIYQILEVILHKNKYHKNDYCILILPDFIVNKFPEYNKIEDEKLFDEVILFPYLQIEHNRTTLMPNLEQAYQNTIQYSIDKFEKVYVAGVHFYFSIYLINQKIKFSCFEDAAGMIYEPYKLYKNIAYKFKTHADIANENGLIDLSNPLINEIFVNKKSSRIKKKQYVFHVMKELQLQRRVRKKILRLFNVEKVQCTKNCKVILTEQFYAMGKMTKDNQKDLYKKIIEKELEDDDLFLVVKPHPDDEIDYRMFSDKIYQMQRVWPAELIPYVLKGKPKELISISSTSLSNLRKYYKITIRNMIEKEN